MAKAKTVYLCGQCGATSPRWSGRCGNCGEWNSLSEHTPPREKSERSVLDSGAPASVLDVDTAPRDRSQTGIGEFDRILGGGLISGSVTLVGGEPGAGKSTLMLQICDRIAQKNAPALYVTGEESPSQTSLRAKRLGVKNEHLLVAAQTDLDTITMAIKKTQPALVVIDSIQMVAKRSFEGAPGSVGQVRECAAELICLAKQTGFALALVGHVTKSGAIAGPKILEHMVDTVLYFEGESRNQYRVLRAVKNRFGSTNEIGVFEMHAEGLREVSNPSELFISGFGGGVGTAIVPCIEGTRPLLVEVQALVTRATYGTPERKVTGVDRNRVPMLLAVLDRRGGLQLGGQDVFVNAAGGVQIEEPAADLAIALAIASSFTDRPLADRAVFIGEIGLGGEIRSVNQIDQRVAEAGRLGFTKAFVPKDCTPARRKGLDFTQVSNIIEALDWCTKKR